MSISAHRGGDRDRRTSIIDAYRAGIDAGVDFIEADIRRTHDGVLVHMHRDRLPSGTPVHLCSHEQYAREMGDQALRLDDLLELARGQVGLHLDLKEEGYEIELMERVLRDFESREFVVTSVQAASLRVIKEAHPDIQVGLTLGGRNVRRGLVQGLWTRLTEFFPHGRIRRFSPDFLAVNHRLARLTIFRFAKKRDIPLWLWTVDRDRKMQRLLADPRVSAVVSNRPQLALRLRDQRRKPPLSKAT